MSIESHINLTIGDMQESVRHNPKIPAFCEQRIQRAVRELTLAREELRTLRAMINKIEANL